MTGSTDCKIVMKIVKPVLEKLQGGPAIYQIFTKNTEAAPASASSGNDIF